MIRGSVFPHSRGGVVSAVMIGFGRAIGETIAVALVIGSSQQISAHLFGPGETLAGIIANQFGESTGVYQAALIGMGVVLLGIHRGRRYIGAVRRRALRATVRSRRMTTGLEDRPLDAHPSTWVARAPDQEQMATIMIVLAFLVALVPLVFIVVYVFQRGSEILDWNFLTEPLPFSERLPGPGMGPAVAGTLLITGAAALMAIPLGILGGIYLNEYGGKSPLARLVRFMSEVMTGVPSIVMGLFIYTFVVLHTHEKNGFAGALALGVLDAPDHDPYHRPDALARARASSGKAATRSGAGRARTIRTVVLPSAAPGIVSGALIAVARAAGETAPLLFTIGLVEDHSNWSLFNGTNTALSTQIFQNARSLFPTAQDRAWGAALTLILIVFVFTILARVVNAFFGRRQAA